MYNTITEQATTAIRELLAAADLKPGSLLVVGCSSSEIAGGTIGHDSSVQCAKAAYAGIAPILAEAGVYLCAQCCEHLNRAIIMEREAAEKYGYEIVSVVPQPKAGGSLATQAYAGFTDPVAVEEIKADAGLDIGFTMIGMHLKKVAVPLRLEHNAIGDAMVLAARTRPKFIGGARAVYDENKI